MTVRAVTPLVEPHGLVMRECQGCGTPVEQKPRTKPRKWCSERCRKAQYGGACVDCGASTNGSDGRKETPRCAHCNGVKQGGQNLRWASEALTAAIREWVSEYGEPPAISDWSPIAARSLNDEARARRFEDAGGRWPWFTLVVRRFGSWNAGIRAAGFEPRVSGGGGGNGARHRSVRERLAA